MHELALFAGAGGGILGGRLLGWRTACAVELDRHAADVLVARQEDGTLEAFPVWDDVRTFDGRAWRGCIDVVSGGFPCQDISGAGKGAGIDGERSGLWGHMARIIDEVRPEFAFMENSPMLTSRGLGRVLGDLAELGFDAEWCVLGADDVGAWHRRKRIWVLARANGNPVRVERGWKPRWPAEAEPGVDGQRWFVADASSLGQRPSKRNVCAREPDASRCGETLADADSERRELERVSGIPDGERSSLVGDRGLVPHAADEGARRGNARLGSDGASRLPPWPTEPDVGRVAHGVAARVDRLRAIGNGQVPRVAAAAFTLLRERGGW